MQAQTACVAPHASGDDDTLAALSDMQFVLERYMAYETRRVRVGRHVIALKAAAEDPGSVQSGKYLWPAAEALSLYLDQWPDESFHDMLCTTSSSSSSSSSSSPASAPPLRVLELGCGVGLLGLYLLKRFSTHQDATGVDGSTGSRPSANGLLAQASERLHLTVVFTDRDHDVLRVVATNIESNMCSHGDEITDDPISRHVAAVTALPARQAASRRQRCACSAWVQQLDWGPPVGRSGDGPVAPAMQVHWTSSADPSSAVVPDASSVATDAAAGTANTSSTRQAAAAAAECGPQTDHASAAGGSPLMAARSFDLLVGSDLMYSMEVLELLFFTVDQYLSDQPHARFLLCTSLKCRTFDSARQTLAKLCQRHNLVHRIAVDQMNLSSLSSSSPAPDLLAPGVSGVHSGGGDTAIVPPNASGVIIGPVVIDEFRRAKHDRLGLL